MNEDNNFWTDNTEKAIVEYIKGGKTSNELYEKEIYPVLHKLTLSVFSKYGYPYFDTSECITDCITHLSNKIDAVNLTITETKLFSYFYISAKYFLMNRKKEILEYFDRYESINTEDDDKELKELEVLDDDNNILNTDFVPKMLYYINKKINNGHNENIAGVVKYILNLFKNSDVDEQFTNIPLLKAKIKKEFGIPKDKLDNVIDILNTQYRYLRRYYDEHGILPN